MMFNHKAKRIVRKSLNLLGYDMFRISADPSKYEIADEVSWLRHHNIQTVIDIGAHKGEFASMIRRYLPDAMILSFEPQPEPYQIMEDRMSRDNKFRAYNFAIGEKNTELDLYQNSYTMSSSLLEMRELHKSAFPYTKNISSISRVQIKKLDDIVTSNMIIENLLIKIDVQGVEDKVIIGGENIIACAKALIVEVSFKSLYSGQPLFDDIYALLRERRFVYMGNWAQLKNPIDGSILQADAVFIK